MWLRRPVAKLLPPSRKGSIFVGVKKNYKNWGFQSEPGGWAKAIHGKFCENDFWTSVKEAQEYVGSVFLGGLSGGGLGQENAI